MSNDTTLTLVLFLVAAAILLQAGAMIGIWLSIRKIPGQIEGIRADVRQRLDPLTQSMTEIVANSREPVRTITANLAEISRLLRDRTSNVDEVVAEMVDKSRLQIIRVDHMVSDLVARVETTADVVQRSVLTPIQEVSAVIKGVRTGLEFLFARRRPSSVTEGTSDEQLFI
jgi:predicted PurR-regulated permease PerM